jgi:antibiotic biosynthesis monooxygenase (ABM) superfamily enzyme
MQARQRQVRAAGRRCQDRRCAEPRPLSPAEPRYRSVLITWLAICPLVTTVLAAGHPLGFSDLPLVARSVILTAIVVPLAVLWVVPALRRAFRARPRPANLDAESSMPDLRCD